MTRFVAFLRGINVGGRSVKKEALKEAFVSLGLDEVATYRQSGNVIFTTDEVDLKGLTHRIEKELEERLVYSVPVFIRTVDQLMKMVDDDPFKNQTKKSIAFLVTMLPRCPASFPLRLPMTIPKSTAEIISSKDSEVYSVTYVGGESALPNPFLESKLKVKSTTRNMNVIKEIAGRYGSET